MVTGAGNVTLFNLTATRLGGFAVVSNGAPALLVDRVLSFDVSASSPWRIGGMGGGTVGGSDGGGCVGGGRGQAGL